MGVARLQVHDQETTADFCKRVTRLLNSDAQQECSVVFTTSKGQAVEFEDVTPIYVLLSSPGVSKPGRCVDTFCDDVLTTSQHDNDFNCSETPNGLRIHRNRETSPPLETLHTSPWSVTVADVFKRDALRPVMSFLAHALSR